MRLKPLPVLLLLCLLLPVSASAWDAVGHRLTAAIALSYLSPEKQQQLVNLLQTHPRFKEDFSAAMPAFVAQGDETTRATWLLGQAAYWPDIARGLPDSDRTRYNRPSWHFIDGAWVRDGAATQGNTYISIAPFTSVPGTAARDIRNESQVDNVMTALDYNTRVLADLNIPEAERAVALCWVLHLIGDIHQPLHTGSLFSTRLFDTGDRGGNGVTTDDGTLHARWDGALAGGGIEANLEMILDQLNGFSRPRIAGVSSDWSQWLNESRGLLLSIVYTEEMKVAIAIADERNAALGRQRLDTGYVATMERFARQRVGLAGLRTAIWIENELP